MEIKNIIHSKGIKMSFVADKMGVSKQTLYSRFNTNMSLEKAKEILDAVDMKLVAVPKDKVIIEGEYTL